MDSQIDQIVIKTILLPLKQSVRKKLQKLVEANKAANWFVIFLSTFMLLNNYEIATKHDRNFAIRHSLVVSYIIWRYQK